MSKRKLLHVLVTRRIQRLLFHRTTSSSKEVLPQLQRLQPGTWILPGLKRSLRHPDRHPALLSDHLQSPLPNVLSRFQQLSLGTHLHPSRYFGNMAAALNSVILFLLFLSRLEKKKQGGCLCNTREELFLHVMLRWS